MRLELTQYDYEILYLFFSLVFLFAILFVFPDMRLFLIYVFGWLGLPVWIGLIEYISDRTDVKSWYYYKNYLRVLFYSGRVRAKQWKKEMAERESHE